MCRPFTSDNCYRNRGTYTRCPTSIDRVLSQSRFDRTRTPSAHGNLGSRPVPIRVPETIGNIEFSISVPSYSIENSFRSSSGGCISFRFRRFLIGLPLGVSSSRSCQCPRRRHTCRTRPARFRSRLSPGSRQISFTSYSARVFCPSFTPTLSPPDLVHKSSI